LGYTKLFKPGLMEGFPKNWEVSLKLNNLLGKGLLNWLEGPEKLKEGHLLNLGWFPRAWGFNTWRGLKPRLKLGSQLGFTIKVYPFY